MLPRGPYELGWRFAGRIDIENKKEDDIKLFTFSKLCFFDTFHLLGRVEGLLEIKPLYFEGEKGESRSNW